MTLPRDNNQITFDMVFEVTGCLIYLGNVWEDPLFTCAFPTLFPTGAGGHLDARAQKVSLEAFAKWALKHHSRR